MGGVSGPPREFRTLFGLLWDVAGRERRALAEEEILHVSSDQLLRFLLPRHEAVLIQDHLHSLFPELPGLSRDVIVDALTELAGPGRGVQTGQFLLKLRAKHHPPG